MLSQTCPSITKFSIEVILRERMRKLGANQKLKSGIFCVLESGICRDRSRNPAPGIRNPQRGIQNLILSLITLHGAISWYDWQDGNRAHRSYLLLSPHKKNLWGTTEGTYSARRFLPVTIYIKWLRNFLVCSGG